MTFLRIELHGKGRALRKLLEARTQLANLLTYMDGKTGAEELVGQIMRDPDLLKTVTSKPKEEAAPASSN